MTKSKPKFAITNPFAKPFDFALQRNPWQAFGFYGMHLTLYVVVVGVLVGFLMAPLMLSPGGANLMEADNPRMRELAQQIGMPMNAVYAMIMVFLMMRAKRLNKTNIRRLIVSFIALFLGTLSPVLGLVPLAWLSTTRVEPTPEAPQT